MDEVLEKFGSLAGPGDETKKTNFDGLYKNWGRLGNQEQRRREILEIQKQSRSDKVDQRRGILDLVYSVEESNVSKSFNRVHYRPNIYVAGFNRVSPSYKNVLMLSEWMLEKPADFQNEWLVVPCPKGTRMLVVATRGSTKCYTKYGKFRFKQMTALPGGNPYDSGKKNHCCVLDCIYVEKIKTMFVLDLLVWKDQPMTDGEAEFRHYWVQSQFAELRELKYTSKNNQLLFTILPKLSCETTSLNDFMKRYPAFECNFPPLDGLLFYHRRAHYTAGETPLVGWLFPYMVPEILGKDVTVHELYLAGKPPGYTNQADFIQKFEEEIAMKSRQRLSSASSTMSITDKCEGDSEAAEGITGQSDSGSMDTSVSAGIVCGVPETAADVPSAQTEEMEEESLLKDAMSAHE